MSSLDIGCISSVTCIADYKQDQDSVSNKDFIQGLEKFVYTMQGKLYTAVFIKVKICFLSVAFKH